MKRVPYLGPICCKLLELGWTIVAYCDGLAILTPPRS